MLNLNHIKVTPRAMNWFCSRSCRAAVNNEIAAQLNISPGTVKQQLRTLFLPAGIREGRKRVKLATAMFAGANEIMQPVNR